MPDQDALLLDTHVWVWLVAGDPRLSPRVVDVLSGASELGGLHIAAISLWEIAMLESKGRIHLATDLLDWMRKALDDSHTAVLALSPEIAVGSVRLPAEFHGDPADRLIVSTARSMNMTLVTYDERILHYSRAQHYVRTLSG